MIYREFQGLKLSALGMGCMRLPVLDGKDSCIDRDATRQMFAQAIAGGVNYFDSAWGYHGGQSELVVGEILKDYPRESYYLASKFPGYDLRNMDKVQAIFEKQLEKCGVEYFDFYLFHNVCEMNVEAYLDPQYGILDYLLEQKRLGRIRHLGFSAHAALPALNRFLDAYGEHMEFCQIELNYFDWEFQNAREKVELLRKWNLPVWVMEPLRGGQLARLSAEHEQKLMAARPDESVPAWAFRFLQGIADVTVTLSGMSDAAQLQANLQTYEEEKPLTESEQELLLSVAQDMIRRTWVPCTGCHYCVSECPQDLPIPELLRLYNELLASGSGSFISTSGLRAIDPDKRPDACLSCHNCEAVCPQQLTIPDYLADFADRVKK